MSRIRANSYATVQLFFDVPHVDVEFLELVGERHSFVANVRSVNLAMPDPDPRLNDGADAEDGLMVLSLRSKIYPFGALETGDYRFVVRVNGEREGVEEFSIGDDPAADEAAPEAGAESRQYHHGDDRAQRLEVVYEDRGGIDVSTIGDGDLMVISPCALLDVIPPFPCDWETQKAKFVQWSLPRMDCAALSRSTRSKRQRVVGNTGTTVSIQSSGGGRGLRSIGNCNSQRRLGGFEVAIRPGEDPPGPATAELRVDPGDPHMVART